MKISLETLKEDIGLLEREGRPEDNVLLNSLRLTYSIMAENKNSGGLTLADVMEKYIGTHEYDGIIGEAQEWFYGNIVKAPWCATFLSWCLAQMGLLKSTIGEKQENVYNLYLELEARCSRVGNYKRGDIIIFSWSGYKNFNFTSNKHCGVATGKVNGQYIEVIGGNQDDSVCAKFYPTDCIVAAYRPDYSKSGLNSLGELPNA